MGLNFLSKLNIGRAARQALTSPPAAPLAKKAVSAAAPLQQDVFVKASRAGTGMLPKPLMPATTKPTLATLGDQNLGFAELVAKNPSLIWSTQMTPRTEQAIRSFAQGTLGQSVKGMDLRHRTAEQVRHELTRRGFSREMGVIKDVRTGRPVINPQTGRPIPMEVWTHRDGGMVRIKPEGDPLSRHRPAPHLSVSVLYPPGASGHDFNNEAFKVDFAGNPLPKWASDARNPFPAATPAGKRFLDDLAARTHINLR
ncbi:MAG: hypothetical protein VKN33_05620 [Candidatus Sericytochromatia bacterium]|nr:hypothetical protein [Candidatus Sericytochromatia bacterium]